MKQNLLTRIFILPLLFLCTSILNAQPLPRSTPEAEGISSQAITDFVNAADKSEHEFHSFMLLRHGKVIAEGWWNPYDADLVHTLYSVSKSFTSTAAGFAVTEGKLSVDDKVISFFPDKLPDSVSQNLAEMRVRDLLTMSTGQYPEPTDTVRNSDDWIKTFLAQPVIYKPGTRFLYNSVATYMLSAIVQKVTGEKIIDYLTPRFFEPLGIKGIDWEEDFSGINTGGWGLRVHTEDMAKTGQFYLQKGNWNGKQILPESWIEEATTAKIMQWPQWIADSSGRDTSDWMQGYCYQFWRCRYNAYRADGAFGQYIIVMPEKDAVVAITCESGDLQGEINLVWQYLLPAFQDNALPENKSKQDELTKLLESLALPLAAKTTSPAALLMSGKKFFMEKNDKDIDIISIDSKGDIINLTLGEYTFPFGAGKWEYSETTRKGPAILRSKSKFTGAQKIAGSYNWKDESTLELKLRYIESPHSETITLRFDKDNIYGEMYTSMPYQHELTKLYGKAE
jgi:CubicO group peptidase (beta-lactamase class C family)